MHYSAVVALAVVTTLTVGGQAFLIPPNMNKVVSEEDFVLLVPQNMESQVVVAECRGCAEDGSDGSLVYDLAISKIGSPRFTVNGADLTPIDGSFTDLEILMPPPFLSVPLLPTKPSTGEFFDESKGWVVQVMYNSYSEIQGASDGEIIKLFLEPTSVDGRVVPSGNTDVLEVVLVRESGKMFIQSAQLSAPRSQGQVVDLVLGEGKCGLLCEFMNEISGWGKKAEEKVGKWGKKLGTKLRPCGKNSKAGSTEESTAVTGGNTPEGEEIVTIMPLFPIPAAADRVPSSPWRRPPHSRPHHRPHHPDGEGHRSARPWDHHHHHHHRPHHMTHGSGAASAVYRIFVQVLVPIAIGVVAGMLVSLMGMVVGHFAVLAYQRAVGAVRRGCNKAQAGEGDEEEVSKGLLGGEDDAPPEYEEDGQGEVGGEKQ